MGMTFTAKYLIVSVFAVVVYSRSLSLEKDIFEDVLQDSNCSCNLRYFNHYKTKECFVERTDLCGCPLKFICNASETLQASAKVCIYQNKDYEVGSKIITSDSCRVCRCRDGVPPYISCVTRECPEIETEYGKDCHLIYENSKCCPTGVECVANETDITTNKTCEYDGKYYPFGSKIYPVDDPCQICICNENWIGVDNSSCYQHDCMFERNKFELKLGCIPVYHESQCCPIEFYCPLSHNASYSFLSSNESSDNDSIPFDDQCTFAGQFYAVDKELLINNPCVKCKCMVPPDFTCVHQTCSPSPSKANCYAVYSDGNCCPTYECMFGDTETVADGCPTPLCSDSSCRIETPPGHECPTCVCDERLSELEHNNLEQVQQISENINQFEQVQQISQNIENIEPFEPVQQALQPEAEDDSSESVLQMMPIRMQDSESQLSVLEKMVLPDPEFTAAAKELENNSFEDNSSIEAENFESDELQIAAGHNFTSLIEPESNNIQREFIESKDVQKRSKVSDEVNNYQTKVIHVEQSEFFPQSMKETNEDLEREGGVSEGSYDDFDDELENFKNKILNRNKTIINEVISINHVVKVPPGCPTPMCEGPWCKIGIPPGEKCPTCICKRPSEP